MVSNKLQLYTKTSFQGKMKKKPLVWKYGRTVRLLFELH